MFPDLSSPPPSVPEALITRPLFSSGGTVASSFPIVAPVAQEVVAPAAEEISPPAEEVTPAPTDAPAQEITSAPDDAPATEN